MEDKKQHESKHYCPEVHVIQNKVSIEWMTTTQLDRAARFGSKLCRR